jgi:hypothetical protein
MFEDKCQGENMSVIVVEARVIKAVHTAATRQHHFVGEKNFAGPCHALSARDVAGFA